jgi:hypothetical protein
LYCRQQGLCCALCCSTVKHQKFTTVTIGPGAHTSLRRDAKHFFFVSHRTDGAREMPWARAESLRGDAGQRLHELFAAYVVQSVKELIC